MKRKPRCKKPRTYKEWYALGFHVRRGQRHTGRNAAGVATFKHTQVEKNFPDYSRENDDDDIDYADTFFCYGDDRPY